MRIGHAVSPAPILILPEHRRYNSGDGQQFTIDGADKLFWKFMRGAVKNIPKVDTAVGQRKLIYFSLGYSTDYFVLWKLCMQSIIDQSVDEDIDVLVICDEKTALLIPDHFDAIRVYKYVLPTFDGPVSASKAKCHIYSWSDIDNYHTILFLDVDILITKSINHIFTLPTQLEVIYSRSPFAPGQGHTGIFHSIGAYRESDWFRFSLKKINAFNCGQYLFKNSMRMKYHFTSICELMKTWPHEAFFEQSFMNTYFNVLELSDTALLKDEVMLVDAFEKETLCRSYKGETLVHFAGPPGDADAKLNRMRTFYARRFRPKSNSNTYPKNRRKFSL